MKPAKDKAISLSRRPEPIPMNVVCSLCGEPWVLHASVDGEVSTLECIRLLKAKSPTIRWYPQPYPVYPAPPLPFRPTWISAAGSTTTPNGTTTVINTCEQRTSRSRQRMPDKGES